MERKIISYWKIIFTFSFLTGHDLPEPCGIFFVGRLKSSTSTLSFDLMSVSNCSPARWTLGILVIPLNDLGKLTGHIMGKT